MNLKQVVMIRQPRLKVWSLLRDKLPELAQALEGIESVVTTAREVDDQRVWTVTNVWHARSGLATLVNATSDAGISWTDRSRWISDLFETYWEVTPHFLGGQLLLRGTTKYAEAMGGAGTRVALEVSAELLPDGMAKTTSQENGIIHATQSIAATVICKNFRRLLDLVDQRLREEVDVSGF